jgi:hypothetical protein
MARAANSSVRLWQVDQEHRVVAAGQPGLEEGEVGGVVRGDVPLDPVEHVLSAVAARGGLDRVDVGARALLGDRVALLALAGDRGPHVPLDLVRRGHVGQPRRRRGGDPAQRVGHPAHLLLHQDLLEGGAAAPAELGRHVGRVQAQFAGPLGVPGGQIGGQLAVGGLGLLLERDELVREGAGPGLDGQVFGRQSVHPAGPLGERSCID